MKSMKVLAIAAVMSAGMAVPAMADYVRIGTVDVGYRMDRDTSYSRFGGGMEGLRVEADRNDVFCHNIKVTFDDGSRQNAFNGMLRDGRPVYIDLRGGRRRVDHIDFVCRSDGFRGAKLYISADVGRYRDDWRRDPFWARLFGGVVTGGMGGGYGGGMGGGMGGWRSIGRVTFEGRRDRENAFAGWAGFSADTIGLRPIDGDARCRRITADFRSGRSADLRGDGNLSRGRVTTFDLPGRDRDLRNLRMQCRAVGDYDVTVEVLVRS